MCMCVYTYMYIHIYIYMCVCARLNLVTSTILQQVDLGYVVIHIYTQVQWELEPSYIGSSSGPYSIPQRDA